MANSSEPSNLSAINNTSEPKEFPTSYIDILERLAPQVIAIDRAISPIFYIIGLILNPITTKIWLSKRMRRNNSSAIYVGVLSIVHTIFLFLHIILELNYAWNIPLYNLAGICEFFNMLYYIPQYFAPLLVLAFTVERYIAVNHPFVKERFCTVRRAVYVSIGLGVFSIQLAALQTYIWHYHSMESQCRISEEAMEFEETWTLVTELLIFCFVPVCVLIFNILVIKEIRRITSESAIPSQSRGSGSQTSTITLLSISFYLILTLLPASVVFALQAVIKHGQVSDFDTMSTDPAWQNYLKYLTGRKIVEEICLSNYSCYFFVYYITGGLFRKRVKEMISCTKCKKKKQTGMTSGVSYTEYTLVTTENGKKNIGNESTSM